MALPSNTSAPGTPMRRGWKDPTPPAITTAPASNRVPRIGLHIEAAVLALTQRGDFLAEMQRCIERGDLLQQAVDELLRAADRQRGDVVNRLVGIELGALAARRAERVDEMAADPQQSELEHLEKTTGAGANDDRLR